MNVAVAPIDTLRSVTAELNYLGPMTIQPRTYTYDPPAGEPRTNIVNDTRAVAIRDLRPLARTATVDVEGFALQQHESAVRDFDDEEEIRRVYYAETEQLMKAATGAERVLIFDHTVRRRLPGSARQPVTRVHVDHTERSGPQRVRDLLLPDEAADLLGGRVQIINLWRPIRNPVRDAPLAVCDARTVKPDQLVPSDLVYRDRVGETYSVRFDPAHRWFYAPNMRPDEALLLKCYDSATDGRARFAPHSAFFDPSAPADAPPRESIELRTLVFHRT